MRMGRINLNVDFEIELCTEFTIISDIFLNIMFNTSQCKDNYINSQNITEYTMFSQPNNFNFM